MLPISCSFASIYRTRNMPIDSRRPAYFTTFVHSIYLSGATCIHKSLGRLAPSSFPSLYKSIHYAHCTVPSSLVLLFTAGKCVFGGARAIHVHKHNVDSAAAVDDDDDDNDGKQ